MEQRSPIVKIVAGSILAIVFLAGISVLAYKFFDQQRKIADTEKLVRETSDLFDKDEAFADKGVPLDPWGNSLVVTIEQGAINVCRVKSKGPDGRLDSPDDILAENRNVNPTEAGKRAGRGTAKFGIGAIKAIKETVKEELNGKK